MVYSNNSWKKAEEAYKQPEFWDQDLFDILEKSTKFVVVKGTTENPEQLNWFREFNMKTQPTNVLSHTVKDIFIFKSIEVAEAFIREKFPTLKVGKNISIVPLEYLEFKKPRKEIVIERLWEIDGQIYAKEEIKPRKAS